MSTVEQVTAINQRPARELSWLDRIESWLSGWGDRLNPILVKEARQALKSRQFTVTFTLLLLAGWGWSVIGIAMKMPDIYYASSGVYMLAGYYFILAVPLLLVVPFSAFRSLASEREDGTYELLSISTLSSRQIVTGKLGSSILQMMVYYSALAPCIAFTYLLRGIDIISVALLLSITFCVSVLLCTIGLVFAGLSRSRNAQALVSVLLLLLLVIVGFMTVGIVGGLLDQGFSDIPFDDPEFWAGMGALFTAFFAYLMLLIYVAAAQNSFTSDNRSTKIRLAMMVQFILFVGWVAYGWLSIGDDDFLMFTMVLFGIHWYIYGTLMICESAKLSPRVQRDLPQSTMGRLFLTWFNPGSGTGYVFTLIHIALLVTACYVAVAVQSTFGIPDRNWGTPNDGKIFQLGAAYLCYATIYMGITRLIISVIPNRERFGFTLPVLIHLLILLAVAALPFTIESYRNNYRGFDYGPAQVSNWAWTLAEILDDGPIDPAIILMLGAAAAAVFLLNVLLLRTEVQTVRIAAPARVQEDDRELQPQVEPRVPIDPLA